MAEFTDITGNKYNNLIVIERTENINGRVAWRCLCDCGNEKIARTGDLKAGKIKSCGCKERKSRETRVVYEFIDNYVIGHVDDKEFYIDKNDYEKIKKFPISINNKGYVIISINKKTIQLHRYLLNVKKGEIIDHINRIPYDNRRKNLRICTYTENNQNKSIAKNNKTGVTGVYLNSQGKYTAQITKNYKIIFLGNFDSIEEAKIVREEAERKYFKEIY